MTAVSRLQILRLEDFPSVWEIFQKTFPKKYNDEFQYAWIYRATAYSWAFWQNDVLQAFIITSYQAKLEDSYHIHFLGVHPSVQKGGFGTTLLHKVIQQAKEQQKPVSLYPIQDDKVIRWYEKQRFSFHGNSVVSPFTGDEEQLMLYREGRNIS